MQMENSCRIVEPCVSSVRIAGLMPWNTHAYKRYTLNTLECKLHSLKAKPHPHLSLCTKVSSTLINAKKPI